MIHVTRVCPHTTQNAPSSGLRDTSGLLLVVCATRPPSPVPVCRAPKKTRHPRTGRGSLSLRRNVTCTINARNRPRLHLNLSVNSACSFTTRKSGMRGMADAHQNQRTSNCRVARQGSRSPPSTQKPTPSSNEPLRHFNGPFHHENEREQQRHRQMPITVAAGSFSARLCSIRKPGSVTVEYTIRPSPRKPHHELNNLK